MKRKRGNIKVVVALVWRECRGRGGVEGVLVYPGRLDLCGLGWFDRGLGWFDGGSGWFGGGLGWFGGGLGCFWVVWGVSMDRYLASPVSILALLE